GVSLSFRDRACDHRSQLAFGYKLTVHPSLTAIFPHRATVLQFVDMHMQHIARHNRLAEASAIYRHEIDELVAARSAQMIDDKRARRLRHCLDNQNAGHDGVAGEMPLKERLVIGDTFDANR